MNFDSSKSRMLLGWLGRLLMIVASTVFTLVMLEVFIRVGFDALPPDIQGEIQGVRRVPWDEEPIIKPVPFQTSRDYQSYLPPDLENYPVRWRDARFTFSTRNLWEHPVGLRVDEPTWPIDIVAFGDSFTFCWTNMEDCWVQQLQSAYGWHVINAGTPGSGPGGQLPLVEEVGVPLEPSLVIWLHYDNDLMDDYVLDTIRGNVSGLDLPPSPDPVRLPRGLARYSALLHLIDNRLDPPPKTNNYRHGQVVQIQDREFIVNTEEYPPVNDTDAYSGIAYGWQRNLEHYQQGIDLVQERLDAPVLIVMVPFKELVYADYLDGALSENYLNRMRANRTAMLEECDARGWHCLDALPALQAATESGELIYYTGDFHLAPYGNTVLAQAIHDYIIEYDLLDTAEPEVAG